MADEKVRYVLDVDDKGSPKLVKFGDAAQKSGKKAEKSFEKAGKAVSDFGAQIPGVSNAMQSLASGPAVMAGAAVAALGVGFGVMIKKSIDLADKTAKLSARLGVSTEQISILSHYAELSGTDIDALATGMGKLGASLSEGDKKLAHYGITAKSVDEALYQVADRIAGTEDPMLRLKIATDAFGRSGQNMLPLLMQGGDALRRMAGEANVVNSEFAKMAEQFNDDITRMQSVFASIGMGIAEHVLPQLQIWLDGVDRIRRAMGLLSKDEEYQEKRTAARARIVDTYAKQLEKRREGEKIIGKVSGAVTVDGMTLQQALAAFDRNNPQNRPTAAPPPSAIGRGFGGGAAPTVARAEKGRAVEVDSEITPAFGNVFGGAGASMGIGTGSGEGAAAAARKKALDDLQSGLDDMEAMAKAASEAIIQDSMVVVAQSASSVLTNAFMQAGDGIDEVFSSIADGFINMLAQMAAELAANALILGFLSMINPAAGAKMAGSMGGLSGLVLGRATGGPVDGGAVMFNERREETIVPRGPVRVEPTASSGNTYIFQVQNPAQATTLRRGLESEDRLGKRGIRR